MNDFNENTKKNGFIGYAHVYLWRCNKENRTNEIDIDVYNKLVELDSKIGTTASEQLLKILFHTTRQEIIMV